MLGRKPNENLPPVQENVEQPQCDLKLAHFESASTEEEKTEVFEDRNSGIFSEIDFNRSNSAIGSKLLLEKDNEKTAASKQYQDLTNYVIGDLIGKGTFGDVYKAVFTPQAKEIAIKIIEFQNFEDHQQVYSLFKEENKVCQILIAKASSLKFLPRTFAAFESNQCGYIITELFDGFTLENLLLSESNISQDQIQHYLASLVLAMEELHQKIGCLHRDIKPENIIILANGCLKLIDFGCSKLVNSKGRCSSIVGTYQYFSPERFGGYYSYESDIWTLAIIAYELVTKQMPFDFSGLNQCVEQEKLIKISNIIKKRKPLVDLPSDFAPNEQLGNMIKQILNSTKEEREQKLTIGYMKSHPYFENVCWKSLSMNAKLPAHFQYDIKQVQQLQSLSKSASLFLNF